MVDLETLGTRPGSVILTIGARKFSAERAEVDTSAWGAFHEGVDIQSGLSCGLTVDGAALYWWLEQSPEALAALKETRPGLYLDTALLKFRQWFGGCQYLWGHGASFDPVLLMSAFQKATSVPLPWRYANIRDTRTLFDVAGFDYNAYSKAHNACAHSALADATCQAEAVCICLHRMRRS